MKYLKKYNEINESLTLLSIIGIIMSLFAIFYAVYLYKKTNTKINSYDRDYEMEEKLHAICGSKIEIHKTKHLSHSPATATNKYILYDESLKNKLTDREFIAVMLHEIYHINNKHSYQKVFMLSLPFGVAGFFGSWLLFILAPILSILLLSKRYSRLLENSADSYTTKYGYNEDLASALVKITSYDELQYHLEKSKSLGMKLVELLNNHPNLVKRIQNLYDKDPKDFIRNVKGWKQKIY